MWGVARAIRLSARTLQPVTLREAIPLSLELAKERGTDHLLTKRSVSVFETGTAEVDGQPTGRPVVGVETIYNFEDPHLRNKYSLFGSNNIRMGMLLEDLDIFAADVAHHFINQNPATQTNRTTLVTACVDRLNLKGFLDISNNLKLSCSLTWSGTSSMEVSVDIQMAKAGAQFAHVGSAAFVFVALDAETMRPTPVPRLVPATEEGKKKFDDGVRRKQRRLHEQTQEQRFPLPAEGQEIHELFLRHTHPSTPVNEPFVWARDAQIRSLHIMHSQDRNLNNHMFGGFLMRLGLETAFTTVRQFQKLSAMCCGAKSVPPTGPSSHPRLVSMEEVKFIAPVEVGSVLLLASNVMFVDTKTNRVWVEVKAVVDKPLPSPEQVVTTTFCFCFECQGLNVPVVPYSYGQALQYIRARRLCEEVRSF